MKKRERIASVQHAIIRVGAGVADAGTISQEIVKNVTGRLTTVEGLALVEAGKWPKEAYDKAVSLGLVYEKPARSAASGSGSGAGSVQNAFKEEFSTLYSGRVPLDDEGRKLYEEWVAAYGVHNALNLGREMVASTKKFRVGLYFIPLEKEKKTAEAEASA